MFERPLPYSSRSRCRRARGLYQRLAAGDNSTINAVMILGGMAPAFSRLIDNSVVVLENIFRHMEMGEPAAVAAEKGRSRQGGFRASCAGRDADDVGGVLSSGLPVRRQPVPSLTALALSVVLSLFASYFVAMTVVPLFCAKFIRNAHGQGTPCPSPVLIWANRASSIWFNGRVREDAEPI